MTNLPEDVLQKLKVRLETDKKRVSERLAEVRAQDPFADASRLNDNAASDAEANEEAGHDRFAAIVEELELEEKKLDEALGKYTNGTYGICANCGLPIDIQRLEALPTATLCLSCEQKRVK